MHNITVKLGPYVAGSAFDEAIEQSSPDDINTDYKNINYIFDMSDVRFITIDSTQYITSFARKCNKHGWGFSITLPARQSVIDFWKLWEFPESFAAATLFPLEEYIGKEERHRISAPQETFVNRSTVYINQYGNVPFRSRNFFGFHSIQNGNTNPALVADSESNWWREKEIEVVLRRRLGDSADYIPSRIVFEAIFNAAKNYETTIIQTALWHHSLYRRQVSTNKRPATPFNLIFWDNGGSILDSIKSAIASKDPLRLSDKDEFLTEYFVKYQPIEREESEPYSVFSNMDIDSNTPDHEIILSSIFPGVSGGHMRMPHASDNQLALEDAKRARRGMGLFVLVETVCSLLGGKVSFRSGNYFMHIRALKLSERRKIAGNEGYFVLINKVSRKVPTFEGNLVSINISPKSK